MDPAAARIVAEARRIDSSSHATAAPLIPAHAVATSGDSYSGTDDTVYLRINDGTRFALDKPYYDDFEAGDQGWAVPSWSSAMFASATSSSISGEAAYHSPSRWAVTNASSARRST